MGNPFDDMVKVDTPKTVVYSQKSTFRNSDQITISVNKRMIERGVFIALILILGGLVVFDPFRNACFNTDVAATSEITGNVVAPAAMQAAPETQPAPEAQPEAVPEAAETPAAVPEMLQEELPYAGNFIFKIKNVDFERDDEDSPKKIKSITLTLDNKWKEFKPLVKVYWYDVKSSNALKDKIRTEVFMSELAKGTKTEPTLESFDSTFFDPQNPSETIEVRLYDKDTQEHLATATLDIK